jgi:hypothetical protein
VQSPSSIQTSWPFGGDVGVQVGVLVGAAVLEAVAVGDEEPDRALAGRPAGCRRSRRSCPTYATAAMKAEAGIVKTQAQTMLPATPQRTAEAFCAEPTPTMAPVMVWVVETGTPQKLAISSVIAPPVSAQKPPTGLSLVIFWPMVLTMRQPPNSVPKLIAA